MPSPGSRSSIFMLVILAVAAGTAAADDCRDYADYPHWVSQLEVPVWASDVIVEGDLAYIAARTGGVVIADVSDPRHPVQVGILVGAIAPEWPASADRLALAGIHLFVTDGQNRLLHVVDVSDPTAPTPVAQVPTGVFPDGLALAGDHLYVAVQDSGVVVFDIGTPTAPQPVGTVPLTGVLNVRIFDDRLYATRLNPTVWIFGLADPAAPEFLSVVSFPHEAETWDVAELGNLAFVAGPLGTWTVDVSDPRAATLVGSIPRGSTSIVIEDDRAYLTPFELEIFDLTDPLAPVQLTYLPEPDYAFSPVRRVAVSGGFAFTAADDAGLLVADLAGYAPPIVDTTLHLPATAERIRLLGDHALAAAGTAGLLVLDLADPASPAQVGSLASEDARAVVTAGQLAYLADGGDGLKIVDLANPAAPQLVGHLDTYSRVAAGVALDGGLVYMATGLNGLMVIDVTDPSAPGLLGQAATAVRAQDVCVDGPYAYVADGNGGLQIVDVSDPTAPFVAVSLDLPGQQEVVLLDGSTLYIGGNGTGVRAFDVSDPTAPVLLGWLPVEARDLALDGHTLAAAGGDGVTFVNCYDPAALGYIGFLPTWEDCPTVALADSFMVIAGDRLHTAPLQCPAVSGAGDLPPGMSAWARLGGHPNPFNPRIEVAFELQRSQRVSLEVYDLAGRWVTVLAAGEYAAATHRVFWDGNDSRGSAAAAGCYFVLLRGERDLQSMKVMLVR